MIENLSIRQGSTFTRTVRWEAEPIVYKQITAVTQTAPAMITAPSHGLTEGWKAAVVSVKGMTQINADDPPKDADFLPVTVLTPDTVALNSVNAASFKPYSSGGYLMYYTAQDLAGYTARMKIKDKVGGAELLSLTTENGGITLNNTAKTIVLTISATATAAFTFKKGVYDLEMVSPTGVVTALLQGSVTVTTEITT